LRAARRLAGAGETVRTCAIVAARLVHGAQAAMTHSLRFLLNGAPVEVTCAPQTTLLEWLRECRGLTGTKEGCAEGDCGACTVVIAQRPAPGIGPADTRGGDGRAPRLTWRPVNACLRFLPSLHGTAVYTVESLRGADAAGLHPVQQAMVAAHASQCGFCTPGFVMSLFALYKAHAAPVRGVVEDALAGNLCRCTGYRPIVDAALAMHALPAPADWRAPAGSVAAAQHDAALAATLARLDTAGRSDHAPAQPPDGPSAATEAAPAGHGQRWHAPRTLFELVALRAEHPEALLVAGATDVALWVTKARRRLPDLIHTGGVAELRTLERREGGLAIGAAVALTDAFPALDDLYPELGEAWLRFASPPIRASATLGGNIANASPIGDSMPALLALGASVELASLRGARTVPLEDFHLAYRRTALAPDEVLARVHVPARPGGLHLRAYKVAKRYDQDISAVFATFALVREGGRIASARIGCGGVAAVPARARRTEAALTGTPWQEASFEAAAQVLATEFTPLDDLRASAAYRRTVLGNLLRRAFLDDGDGAPVRIDALAPTP
jgi:xanthine dehydrogenase small subunit